jgi:signal peptide peptidase SppA
VNLVPFAFETVDLQAALIIDQFADVLVVDPTRLPGLIASAQSIRLEDLKVRAEEHQASFDRQKSYRIEDGIAHVNLNGVLSKNGSSMSRAGSTTAAKYALRQAAKDPQTRGILFNIESPGGAWSGTTELNNTVAEIAKSMPLYVAGEDLVASGGYLAATSAKKIFLNDAGRVGSIGAYTVLVDSSKAAENRGYQVKLIKFGANKGAGVEGVAIGAEALDYYQRQINEIGAQFVEQVAAGRGRTVEQVTPWATGETYSARNALTMGLIDVIGTPEEAAAALQSAIKGKVSVSFSGVKAMTLNEIKAACEGINASDPADQGFLVRLGMQDGLTPASVQTEWAKELVGRNAKAKADLDAAKALADKNAQTLESERTSKIQDEKDRQRIAPGGNKKPKDRIEDGTKAPQYKGVHPFIEAVADHQKVYGLTRQEAVLRVSQEHPDLRESYILSANPGATTIKGNPNLVGASASRSSDDDMEDDDE